MDEHLLKLTEEFITQRVNFHGSNETEVVQDSFIMLRDYAERLERTLNDEQRLLLRDVKNAYGTSTGELNRYYFEAGIRDSLALLLGWKDR